MKPMLAATLKPEDIPNLPYPVWVSKKLDGIRVLVHPELGPVTRSLEPVRNLRLREKLVDYVGYDGEVIVGPQTAADVFRRTTSAVMSGDGEIEEAKFYVFDNFLYPTAPYNLRNPKLPEYETEFAVGVHQHFCESPKVLYLWEEYYLKLGYEGIMIRKPDGIYKFGRSTLREGYLLKLKRMSDTEATILGYEPLYTNTNEPVKNALGLQERSHARSGRVATDRLGSLTVLCDGFSDPCSIGTGFTDADRNDLWARREELIGRRIVVHYQEIGVKDVPRFPSFKGFRED